MGEDMEAADEEGKAAVAAAGTGKAVEKILKQ